MSYRLAVRTLLVMVAAALPWSDGTVRAEAQRTDAAGADQVSPAADTGGFWPTPSLTRSLVRRWTLDIAEVYDLSREQYEQLESRMLERWPAFFEKNREKLQPLVNEYLELRMSVEPPTADQVASWAARAIPAFDRIRDEIKDAQQDTLDVLDAEQRREFEVQRMKLTGKLAVAEGVLKQWSVGSFRVKDVWDEPNGPRQYVQADAGDNAPPAAAHSDQAAAPPASPHSTRVAEELHEWQRYVADFCDRYELDRSQRNAAESILREMLSRADDYARLNRERILAVERAIEDPTGYDETAFDKEINEVYGPIDAMFRELDERIHRLPTEGQFRKVQIEEGIDGARRDRSRKQRLPEIKLETETIIQPATTQPDRQ